MADFDRDILNLIKRIKSSVDTLEKNSTARAIAEKKSPKVLNPRDLENLGENVRKINPELKKSLDVAKKHNAISDKNIKLSRDKNRTLHAEIRAYEKVLSLLKEHERLMKNDVRDKQREKRVQDKLVNEFEKKLKEIPDVLKVEIAKAFRDIAKSEKSFKDKIGSADDIVKEIKKLGEQFESQEERSPELNNTLKKLEEYNLSIKEDLSHIRRNFSQYSTEDNKKSEGILKQLKSKDPEERAESRANIIKTTAIATYESLIQTGLASQALVQMGINRGQNVAEKFDFAATAADLGVSEQAFGEFLKSDINAMRALSTTAGTGVRVSDYTESGEFREVRGVINEMGGMFKGDALQHFRVITGNIKKFGGIGATDRTTRMSDMVKEIADTANFTNSNQKELGQLLNDLGDINVVRLGRMDDPNLMNELLSSFEDLHLTVGMTADEFKALNQEAQKNRYRSLGSKMSSAIRGTIVGKMAGVDEQSLAGFRQFQMGINTDESRKGQVQTLAGIGDMTGQNTMMGTALASITGGMFDMGQIERGEEFSLRRRQQQPIVSMMRENRQAIKSRQAEMGSIEMAASRTDELVTGIKESVVGKTIVPLLSGILASVAQTALIMSMGGKGGFGGMFGGGKGGAGAKEAKGGMLRGVARKLPYIGVFLSTLDGIGMTMKRSSDEIDSRGGLVVSSIRDSMFSFFEGTKDLVDTLSGGLLTDFAEAITPDPNSEAGRRFSDVIGTRFDEFFALFGAEDAERRLQANLMVNDPNFWTNDTKSSRFDVTRTAERLALDLGAEKSSRPLKNVAGKETDSKGETFEEKLDKFNENSDKMVKLMEDKNRRDKMKDMLENERGGLSNKALEIGSALQDS